MLLIKCPWCGERPETEFTYKGDANTKRPTSIQASNKDWSTYIFLRKNNKGLHNEFWQHTSSCRQFLKVRRNVVTHEILATGKPNDDIESNMS
jgi:sarcosine oxidase subunit delta